MYSPFLPRIEDIKDPPNHSDEAIYFAVEGTDERENRKYLGVPLIVDNMLLGFRKDLIKSRKQSYVEMRKINDDFTLWAEAQMAKTSYNESISIRWMDIRGDTL